MCHWAWRKNHYDKLQNGHYTDAGSPGDFGDRLIMRIGWRTPTSHQECNEIF